MSKKMFTIETGSGFWNPLLWSLVIVVVLLMVYVLRGFGNKKFKEKTEQTKSFLSGNPEYEKERLHIKSSNLYWGFTEAMSWIYDFLEKIDTGLVGDYVLWFVIITAVLFMVTGVL